MKKRLFVLIVSMIAILSLQGCTSSEAQSPTPEDSTNGTQQTEQAEENESNFDLNREITVVSREDGSGTRGAFIELFGIEVKHDDGTKKDMTTKEADIVNNTEVMMTSVSSNEYAIGYVSLGSLNDSVKALTIGGVTASAENVKNGTYEVSRPFNIAYQGEASGLAKDFIDFILSAEGQGVVSKSYITIDDNAQPFQGTMPEGKIVVAGSSSVSPIMEKLKEAYEQINTNATIEIQMSDSSAGMASAMEGTCDIGMASRELKDSEKEALTSMPIALDGIAVIVNHENSVTDLSKEQVRQIFTGEALLWNEV